MRNVNKHSEKVMSATEAAYVAGFMDGEGTIGIVRETRKEALAGYRYSAYCNICNTCHPVLEAIQAMVGNGRIGIEAKPSPNHKDLWRLHFTVNQIKHLLPQIIPYLVIKQKQAKLVMEFFGLTHDTRNNYSDNKTGKQHEYWEALRHLNTRGLPKEHVVYQGIRAVHYPERQRCSVEGCDLIHVAKGYCRKHYKQMFYATERTYGKKPCPVCGKKIPESKIFSAQYCSTKCKRRANYLSWRKNRLGRNP